MNCNMKSTIYYIIMHFVLNQNLDCKYAIIFVFRASYKQPNKMNLVSNRTLECRNLHHYLKTLPSDVLDQLYNHPATCLAVFRFSWHLKILFTIASLRS